ncbi:MAG: TonB-dependent receptor [Acidobacteria bacterium]|nr:TonB-dependent receptor [Acidobacteriota bacterium]
MLVLFASVGLCQDPTGALEGRVVDGTDAAVPAATVRATHLATGLTVEQQTTDQGAFRFPLLRIGAYELTVDAEGFARTIQRPIELEVGDIARLEVKLEVASSNETVVVEAAAPLVRTADSSLGRVVTGREMIELPLNGRNFSQLGLLQAGVAPPTAGVVKSGGSLRSGHAYSVNGMRPESNNYLVDGARTVNRVDGGFALRVPVDTVAEFRILTHTAPPEYGGTSGSTTSVVTRSGGNDLHGVVYEFLRNDKLDARNFFSTQVEPLKQNQFGATLGGPIRKDKAFFYGYYEGFHNRQGVTRAAVVPTPGQRVGDFSDLIDPQTGQPRPLINYLTGDPYPNNQIPADRIHAISRNVQEYYPLGNRGPSLFSSTQVGNNDYDQGGARIDWLLGERDTLSFRFAQSVASNLNPLSIKGAGVPGFPVGDDISTTLVTLSETHQISPYAFNSIRAAFFRNDFFFDKRINKTPPSALGFEYESTQELAEGPPFFNINGYAPVGDPITGPRDSVQDSYELYDSLSWFHGRHSLKVGGEFRRTIIDARYGIASNGFFVFAPFPTSDPYANFLTGNPVVFFQAGGDLARTMRNYDLAGFVQDEWRVAPKLTLNLGMRWEVVTPFDEKNDRLNAWAPGEQSTVRPDAPEGLLFPGDAGVAKRLAPVYKRALGPRVGVAYAPGKNVSIRAGYGIFYDGFTNGANAVLQAPVSALPWTQAYQIPGPFLNFANPFGTQPPFNQEAYPKPTTVLTIDRNMRPTYAQNWNLSIQRSFLDDYLIEAQYVGTKGTRVVRFVEANPSVYGPGATSQNADQRRVYAGCSGTGPCDFASAGLLVNASNSTYHAAQLSFSRRFSTGAGFQVSYWYSKALDYASSLNLSGSAPQLIAGENDLPQNPFDWNAEHGPSLFDARQRLTASGMYRIPGFAKTRGATKMLLDGLQLNGILTLSGATPFTVYDTTNVSLQGSHPEVSGFFSSRPDLVGDPNAGESTVEQWISPQAFRRLNPLTDAGKFGNAGRNIARGPGMGNLDIALIKDFAFSERTRLQFRAECFNLTNHANFALPVNDLASPSFGRILEAGPSRLIQFGLKLFF